MTVLDVSIVTVALPSIKNSLQVSDSTLQWVLIAYSITFGGFLLLGGRAADLLGRRRMFMIGVSIFSAASLACGLARHDRRADCRPRGAGGRRGDHLARRAVDHHDDVREGPERNKALGIWGAMGGSGAAAGVLFGGVLTEVRRLGVDLLRQRPGRRARARADASARA